MDKYLTFPIGILHGFIKHPQEVITKAINWCMADEAIKTMDKSTNSDDGIVRHINSVVSKKRKNGQCFKCGFTPDGKSDGRGRGTAGTVGYGLMRVYKQYPGGAGCAFVSIPLAEVVKVYNDDAGKIAEWDLLAMLGYWALRSIEGRNHNEQYKPKKCNNNLMWARMAGYKTWQEFEDAGTAEEYGIKKYMSLYYARKLRDCIQTQHKSVKIYANGMRGFRFTTRQEVSLDSIIEYTKRNTKKAKDAARRAEIKRIEREVNKRLSDGVI